MTIFKVYNWLEFLQLAETAEIPRAMVTREKDGTLTVRLED